jgi:hypothetical protein
MLHSKSIKNRVTPGHNVKIILTIYCEKTRDPQEVLWTMQGDPGPHHPVLSADTIM